MMPYDASSVSPFAASTRSRTRSSTSSPTIPVSVNLVASPLTNGTPSSFAMFFMRYVLPEPVGPSSRMFGFV